MHIGDILGIISLVWILCTCICIIIYIDEDTKIDISTMLLFPANLIFILKIWWKSIIKAIKS